MEQYQGYTEGLSDKIVETVRSQKNRVLMDFVKPFYAALCMQRNI